MGDISLVTTHFREVLRLQPDVDFTAYFADETPYRQAVAGEQFILSIAPKNASVHMSLGMTSSLLSDFASGWSAYLWRFRAPGSGFRLQKILPQPFWLSAESLQSKTILLLCEQG